MKLQICLTLYVYLALFLLNLFGIQATDGIRSQQCTFIRSERDYFAVNIK